MPRRAASLPLVLPPRQAGLPAYRWLYAAIRSQIIGGRLSAGLRLPATRDLARQFGLARGTVVTAFELLQAEGYVETGAGSGTFVASVTPLSSPRRGSHGTGGAPPPVLVRHLSKAARQVSPFPQHARASARAFRANQPALDLFPAAAWARVASRCLRRASPDLLGGCDPMGFPPLRAAIAEYLGMSRGVTCTPAQVAIVSGTQEALALAATLVVNAGDTAFVEDPGYTGAVKLLETRGARLRSVAIDGEGAVVPSTREPARLAYLTPAHQFPLATCMTMARRLQWLAWARTTGALLFEDDYDSEFRYSGRPVGALQGLDRDGLVLFAGSFSKVLCPALRLGYLVVPDDLIDRVSALVSVTSRHASGLMQAVLADFMALGHFTRHLRCMRDEYGERHDALLAGATRWLAGRLDVAPVEAGLQTVGYPLAGTPVRDLIAAAATRDVEIVALSRFARSPIRRDGALLGFAAVPTAEIARGLQGLAKAFDRVR